MDKIGTKQTEMCIRVVENRQEFLLAEADGLDGTAKFDALVQSIEDIRAKAYDQSRAQSAFRERSAHVDETREEFGEAVGGHQEDGAHHRHFRA